MNKPTCMNGICMDDTREIDSGEKPKITTGRFSITDISKDKIWIMKESGKDAGEGSEFSKGFFDTFLSNFFDKYM